MFGEHEIENSRSPSPWDPFLPSPPSEVGSLESRRLCNGIPKLVPEVEEGNVEYKLKLTDISPARFARLVTQLKWRLLEGGGQAFYELGVADSGALIGLSVADLEQSLETLEMMAGEIGGSVIVVKEIEVPPAMVTLADKVSEYIDPETGEWTERMSNRRMRRALLSGDSAAASFTETEPDLSAIDTDDASSSILMNDELPSHSPFMNLTNIHPISHPDRPRAQSSPLIEPLDDSLALFSMEPEPEFSTSTDSDSDTHAHVPDTVETVDVSRWIDDMTIQAVYKPRPVRRRTSAPIGPAIGGKHGRRIQNKGKDKRKLPSHGNSSAGARGVYVGEPCIVPQDKEARALQKRLNRDRHREEKRKVEDVLSQTVPTDRQNVTMTVSTETAAADDVADTTALASALHTLHVSVQPAEIVITDTDTGVVTGVEPDGLSYDIADLINVHNKATKMRYDGTVAVGTGQGLSSSHKEPRLIVEALVVRKMSLEEAFLDFGNLG